MAFLSAEYQPCSFCQQKTNKHCQHCCKASLYQGEVKNEYSLCKYSCLKTYFPCFSHHQIQVHYHLQKTAKNTTTKCLVTIIKQEK